MLPWQTIESVKTREGVVELRRWGDPANLLGAAAPEDAESQPKLPAKPEPKRRR